MTDMSVEFASLLCSRLCHDLLSPVGAISNGIELLTDEDDPAMRERVLELLAESVRVSTAKLKFFRLAFGAASGFDEAVPARDAEEAIQGLFGGDDRIQLGWMVAEPTLPKGQLKILLNLALIAGDALVRGGRLDIGAEGGEVVVRAEGPRLAFAPELRQALLGEMGEAELSPRTAAAWLVHNLAAGQGGSVIVSDGEPGVLLLGAALPRS
ncbi:histidine phosphotransferase [Sphingomonas oleivorans]|uniref:Histidine phosphotransferase n=1 Tax=Sphingomonas oleivorans TaxID=1735121 RepID=A0A2T5FTH7_9SPHN|nr:histidine phosphotransferase family protein [Sphingomonas oleivorans]PTQ07364.1 histidine phosphotransferase [Sphingomonas oleivorans]